MAGASIAAASGAKVETPTNLEAMADVAGKRQHVVSRAELIAQGFHSSTIRSWIRTNRLVTVLQGVYSYGRDIETKESAWQAALLAAGEEAVLTGRSACEAWGIVRLKPAIPRMIEVSRPASQRVRFLGLSPAMRGTQVNVRCCLLEAEEITWKQGMRVTTPARSLIDFAVNASEIDLKFAFLEACRLGLFSRADAKYCLRRIYRRRGAAKLRPLLASWVPELRRTRSVLEGLFLLAWAETARPMPRVNAKVNGYEVDFLWKEEKVILETDGAAFHSDPLARHRDLAKTRDLEVHGYRVIRVSYRELADHPQAVIIKVTTALKS